MDEYRKKVGSSVYSQVNYKDWLPTYKDYYSYDPRIVQVLRIGNSSIIMERLEGFTMNEASEVRKLNGRQRRHIINEAFDIYNKQFKFRHSTLGPMDVWAHGDFCLQNLMICDGDVRLIDPESFDKRSLKHGLGKSMKIGKFLETYIDFGNLW